MGEIDIHTDGKGNVVLGMWENATHLSDDTFTPAKARNLAQSLLNVADEAERQMPKLDKS